MARRCLPKARVSTLDLGYKIVRLGRSVLKTCSPTASYGIDNRLRAVLLLGQIVLAAKDRRTERILLYDLLK